jgi:hypothetical protein
MACTGAEYCSIHTAAYGLSREWPRSHACREAEYSFCKCVVRPLCLRLGR